MAVQLLSLKLLGPKVLAFRAPRGGAEVLHEISVL